MTPAQIKEQVQESRKAQGLSETVAGPVLDQLAAEVLAQAEEVAAGAA
jgi:hypothetical protein